MITCRNHPERPAYVKSRGLCHACYQAAHRAGTITPITQCCLWCCEPFTGRAHRRYCSRACRDKARGPRSSTRRQAAREPAPPSQHMKGDIKPMPEPTRLPTKAECREMLRLIRAARRAHPEYRVYLDAHIATISARLSDLEAPRG